MGVELDGVEIMRVMESELAAHRRAVGFLQSRLATHRRDLRKLQDDISTKNSVIKMLEELIEEVGPLTSPEAPTAAAESAPPEPPPEQPVPRNQAIREAVSAGARVADQAAEYGVSPARIYQILKTA